MSKKLPDGAISIREYARLLGVSDTAVKKAYTSGKIIKGIVYPGGKERPYVLPEIANQEWGSNFNPSKGGDNTHVIESLEKQSESKLTSSKNKKNTKSDDTITDEELGSNPDLDENTTLTEAMRIQAIYKAKMLKLEYDEHESSLIDKKEIDGKLFNLGKEIRVGLENLPGQIVDNVMAATNRNESLIIMKTAIQEAVIKIVERLRNGV